MDQPTPPEDDFQPALSGYATGDSHPSHMVLLITNHPDVTDIVERCHYNDCTIAAAIPRTPEEDTDPNTPKIEEYLADIVSHNASHGLVTHVHV